MLGSLMKRVKCRRLGLSRRFAVAALLLLGGAVPASAAFVDATPAFASADGCSYWGYLGSIHGLPIYPGALCSHLDGYSNYVNYVSDGWDVAGTVCNWNITAEFFNVYGQWYTTYNGPIHYGCGWTGSDAIGIHRWMQPGLECSTLKTNGTRLTSVCHSIS